MSGVILQLVLMGENRISMELASLRQLVTDLWAFINNAGEVTVHAGTDGFYAGLRERVVEALNLDE